MALIFKLPLFFLQVYPHVEAVPAKGLDNPMVLGLLAGLSILSIIGGAVTMSKDKPQVEGRSCALLFLGGLAGSAVTSSALGFIVVLTSSFVGFFIGEQLKGRSKQDVSTPPDKDE